MSQWTSSHAIENDLSLAQGGCAGAGPRHALGARERPPALRLHEETPEEYFGEGAGVAGAAAGAAPDLALIQHLLQMARDVTEDEVVTNDDTCVISKLRPTAAEFRPGGGGDAAARNRLCGESAGLTKQCPKPTGCITPSRQPHDIPRSKSATEVQSNPKVARRPHPSANDLLKPASPTRKLVSQPAPSTTRAVRVNRHRNIALLSIMEAIQSGQQQNNQILIPNDVPTHQNISVNASNSVPPCFGSRLKTESQDHKIEDEVNDWMSQMTAPIRRAQPCPVVLDAANVMFKRKNKPTEERPLSGAHVPTAQAPVRTAQVRVPTAQAYVPTAQARDYYETLVEKSRVVDGVADDIWTKIECEMKKRDEMRRLMAGAESPARGGEGGGRGDEPRSALGGGAGGDPLWLVRLSAPRHPLHAADDGCVVCRACLGAEAGAGRGLQRVPTEGDLRRPPTPPSEYDTASDVSQ